MAKGKTKERKSGSIVAVCKQNCKDGNPCEGRTSDNYDCEEKSDAMACCWHRDGCPGGHDDRTYDFD